MDISVIKNGNIPISIVGKRFRPIMKDISMITNGNTECETSYKINGIDYRKK